ncbi:unnamed protein product [Phytophthora fragariaefolia]|uniref:Unnamed protein product n=1 Tax=Phytophthora fragariaefolia TaxID=1490495 RepID=A0A9W6WSE8_9STRA|nr:unnamed protein product [Phytophthora fragariaefolia]
MDFDGYIAKVLGGYKPKAEVKLQNLSCFDSQTLESIDGVQCILFATCYKLKTESFNISNKVLDLTSSLGSTHLAEAPVSCENSTQHDTQPCNPEQKPSEPGYEQKVIDHQAAVIKHLIENSKLQNARMDLLEARMNGNSAQSARKRFIDDEDGSEVSEESKKNKWRGSATHLHATWFTWYAQEPYWQRGAPKQRRSKFKLPVAYMNLFIAGGFILDSAAADYRDRVLELGKRAKDAILTYLKTEHGITSRGSSAILKHLQRLHNAGALDALIVRHQRLLQTAAIQDPSSGYTQDVLDAVSNSFPTNLTIFSWNILRIFSIQYKASYQRISIKYPEVSDQVAVAGPLLQTVVCGIGTMSITSLAPANSKKARLTAINSFKVFLEAEDMALDKAHELIGGDSTALLQGISLFKDPTCFLTCPLFTLAAALTMQTAPNKRFLPQFLTTKRSAANASDVDELSRVELLKADDSPGPLQDAHPSPAKRAVPGAQAYMNRLLVMANEAAEKKHIRLISGLTSHSFRRGAAMHANDGTLAENGIIERGGWQLDRVNKAFGYMLGTTQADQRVARVLSGWSPKQGACLPSLHALDPPTRDRARGLQALLWWSGIGNFAVDLDPSTWDERLVFAFTLPGTGYTRARPTHRQDTEYPKIEVNPDVKIAWPGVCQPSFQPTARGSGKQGKEYTPPRQPQAKINNSTIHLRSDEFGQGNEASTNIGSPTTPLKQDRSTERQSFGRSSTDGTVEGPVMDLEDKPRPPPQVPSGTPAGLDENLDPPDESPPAQAGTNTSTQPRSGRSTAKKKTSKSKPSRKKIKAPDSETEDRGDLMSDDQLTKAYYKKELHTFLINDTVMRVIRPKPLGELQGPVSPPAAGPNKQSATKALMRLLKETGIIAESFEAEALFDLKLSEIKQSCQSLFEPLAPLRYSGGNGEFEPTPAGEAGIVLSSGHGKVPEGTASASDAAKPRSTGDQDVEMESVGSPDQPTTAWEYDPDDLDLGRPARHRRYHNGHHE